MSVRYEIRSGLKEKVDYNGDGKVDANDNVVIRYINNVPVEQILLTKKNEKKLIKLLKDQEIKDKKAVAKGQALEKQQRIVYERVPSRRPPPLVVQQDTSFATNAKIGLGLGAGAAVGNMAVNGAVDLLSDMFN